MIGGIPSKTGAGGISWLPRDRVSWEHNTAALLGLSSLLDLHPVDFHALALRRFPFCLLKSGGSQDAGISGWLLRLRERKVVKGRMGRDRGVCVGGGERERKE